MENLPQDIMFDVFSRLPVKSVVRLRCICKSWCFLISEPQFVKTHLNRAITDLSVGCQRVVIPSNKTLISIDYEALKLLRDKELKQARRNNGGNACTVLDFPWSGPDHHVRFVGSCHGMVALVVDRDKIILCNPCTREFRELPKPTSISINFRSCINGGLGYDSYMDDYKFVIPIYENKYSEGYCSGGELKAVVFSLRSNSWRILRGIPPDILCIYGYETGVFSNGALHWIAICETGQQIISLDLATEKFQKLLSLPPDQGGGIISYDYRDLILLGGCLSVSASNRKTQVWVMKEYGVEASWTKLFTVEIMIYDDYHRCSRPLCFSKNGELLVDVDDEIRIYNPKDQNSRKLYKGFWSLNNVVLCIESLVSPHSNVENNSHSITQLPKERRQ